MSSELLRASSFAVDRTTGRVHVGLQGVKLLSDAGLTSSGLGREKLLIASLIQHYGPFRFN